MPFFVIVSGFFFKEDEKPIEMLKKLLIKFVLPTFICALLVNLYYQILVYNNNLFDAFLVTLKQIIVSYTFIDKINLSWADPLGIIWFLPYLAVVKTIFYIDIKIFKKNNIVLLLLVAIETYIGYILGIKGYYLPFSVDVALASMFFFYIGYILKKYLLIEKILNDKKILLLCLGIWFIGIKYGVIELATRNYSNGFFTMLTAICGTVIILKFSKILYDKFCNITKPMIWYGKTSMYILGFHYIETCIIPYSNFVTVENPMLYRLVIIILKICIVTICSWIYIKLKNIFKNIL